MKTITTLQEFITLFSAIKCGGQFATIYGSTPIQFNVYPIKGSTMPKVKFSVIAPTDFAPTSDFHISYNWAKDYESAMAKALGVDTYDAHDDNRIHLIPNVLMQYKSTQSVCLIYMPNTRTFDGIHQDGRELTADEQNLVANYQKPKSKSNSTIEYRTIKVQNIKKIVVGGETYIIKIV